MRAVAQARWLLFHEDLSYEDRLREWNGHDIDVPGVGPELCRCRKCRQWFSLLTVVSGELPVCPERPVCV